MNMFNSVELRKPRYNKFDLSHDRKFSTKMGDLVPILCQEILPGDRFRVDSEAFIRFAPMLAPIMHKVDVFVHYFFVPNRLIWSEWESFITGGAQGTDAPVHPYFVFNGAGGVNQFFLNGGLPDYLGYPTLPTAGTVITNPVNLSVLPMRAYQRIFDQYYRDQTLQPSNPGSLSSGVQNPAEVGIIAQLRQRAWEKDYFTSALPFAQRGGEVSLPFEVNVNYSDFATAIRTAGPNATGPLSADGVNGGQIEDSTGATVRIENIESIDSASVTIAELRRSARLQEWLEKNATGGARYVEQIYAHFGVRSSDARLQRPEYLGGGKQPVSISEVLGTNQDGATEPQGNMSGHGVSYGRTNRFARRFEEHGFVMGIMSVLPRTAYQQGIPKTLMRFDRFDFAWPEFANIGEQEIKLPELWYDYSGPASELTETFGYQSRYAEYKYVPSSVHGEFKDSLAFWHMGRIFDAKPELNSQFVTSDPTRRIFAVTDPNEQELWCHVYNNVQAIRPLPYYGTPAL